MVLILLLGAILLTIVLSIKIKNKLCIQYISFSVLKTKSSKNICQKIVIFINVYFLLFVVFIYLKDETHYERNAVSITQTLTKKKSFRHVGFSDPSNCFNTAVEFMIYYHNNIFLRKWNLSLIGFLRSKLIILEKSLFSCSFCPLCGILTFIVWLRFKTRNVPQNQSAQ